MLDTLLVLTQPINQPAFVLKNVFKFEFDGSSYTCTASQSKICGIAAGTPTHENPIKHTANVLI